jgi:hypothetical protein
LASTRERVSEESVQDDPAFQGRWHAPARRCGDEEQNKEEEASRNTWQPLETPMGDMSSSRKTKQDGADDSPFKPKALKKKAKSKKRKTQKMGH